MDRTLQPVSSIFIPSYAAHVGSLLLTTSYVGSLYLSKVFLTIRKTPPPTPPLQEEGAAPAPVLAAEMEDTPREGERDHPKVIKSRMKAVSWATAFSCATVVAVVKTTGNMSWLESLQPTARLLGLSKFPSVFAPYTLAPILFAGPLFARYIDQALPWQFYGYLGYRRRGERLGLLELRNYVVGPSTEELVFRSALLALNILGGINFWKLVFVTPLWFGIAHAHHAVEVFTKGGRTSQAAVQAIVGGLFQLSYTTLFGWFASYLFLRTGSVLPPLLAHAFCNYMGIYLPSSAIRRHPDLAFAIWITYLAGIVAFAYGVRWL